MLHDPRHSIPNPATGKAPTLADVLLALRTAAELSPTRGRDLRSAVRSFAALAGLEPAQIPLDLERLRARFAAIQPAAGAISAKRLANIRSDLLAAIRASGLKPVIASRHPLSGAWGALIGRLASKRQRVGISRLARYASAEAIDPRQIDDRVLDRFAADVRARSLHRKPGALHRSTTVIWNEIARALPDLALQELSVPSNRPVPRRIDWALLPVSFRQEVDDHLAWCRNLDPFTADARPRALAPASIRLRREQIHAAASALVDSGTEPAALGSLADLLCKENFVAIARRRCAMAKEQENQFNIDLLKALVQIGREWVKLDANHLAELRRITSKMPSPRAGLTAKNKRFLRQFDDPGALQRLRRFPGRLWRRVHRAEQVGSRLLAQAQAALAVEFLTYMPVRIQNLHQLRLGTHLFLRDGPEPGAVLEIPASETKNGLPIEFDVPAHLAQMLAEYCSRIVPKAIGRRSETLFVNPDGTPKHPKTLSSLITRTVRKHAALELTPHQFRHLTAKLMLDHAPGAFELVKQLLGHKNLKTTTQFYAGIDSRRAARHHAKLLEAIDADAQHPVRGRQRRRA